MRILIIEDDPQFSSVLEAKLTGTSGVGTVKCVTSRSDAQSELDSSYYDLIILDLKVPTEEGMLDASVEHGRAVLAHARRSSAGTPVIILTGSPAERFIPEFIEQAHRVDLWGDGQQQPMLSFFPKSELDSCLLRVRDWVSRSRAVEAVELSYGTRLLRLRPEVERLIRLFTRKRGGDSCFVAEMGGGRSGSQVLRLQVSDGSGALKIDAVAKIASINDVKSESRRYDENVPRLRGGDYAPKVEEVCYGAKNTGGLFYRLLEGFERDLFALLRESPETSAEVIAKVAKALEPWGRNVPHTRVEVGDVRRSFLTDVEALKVAADLEIDISAVEALKIKVRQCCVHGDLHGGNILVNPQAAPILLDFGRVGAGFAAADPVTLELSCIFHPDSPMKLNTWPAESNLQSFRDLSAYLGSSPYKAYIQACREYASKVAAGDNEVLACSYGYVLRQLKYPDVDQRRGLTLLNALMRELSMRRQ